MLRGAVRIFFLSFFVVVELVFLTRGGGGGGERVSGKYKAKKSLYSCLFVYFLLIKIVCTKSGGRSVQFFRNTGFQTTF